MFDRIARVYDRLNSVMTAGHGPPLAPRAADLAERRARRPGAGRGHGHRRPGGGAAPPRGPRARAWWAWTSPRPCWSWRGSRSPPSSSSRRAARWSCPTPTASSPPPRSGSARATSPTWAWAWPRWPAWSGPAGGWWCWRSPRPRSRRCRWFFRLWFDRVVPVLGRLAGDSDAYTYLPSSVRRFPGPEALARRAGRRRARSTWAGCSRPAGSSPCTTARCRSA